MIEKLSEQTSLWEYLQTVQKPIFLYGMGNGADKILAAMAQYGVSANGVFASEEFLRGHSFHGFPVQSLAQVRAQFGREFVILLAFGTFREPLLSYLYDLAKEQECYAPDVPVCADDPTLFTPDTIRAHEADFDRVYQRLADDCSRQTFVDVLNFKISGKPAYLERSTTDPEEAFALLSLGEDEDYVDLGAYNGDTVASFLAHTNGKYRSVLALEPDRKNYKKLVRTLQTLGVPAEAAVQAGAWSREDVLYFSARAGRSSSLSFAGGKPARMVAVDDLLGGRRASFVKLDVEGAEEQALLGLRQTIARHRPKLLLSLYHRNSDLWKLPLLLEALAGEGYRLYFRHHPYLPAWDLNLYAVPT